MRIVCLLVPLVVVTAQAQTPEVASGGVLNSASYATPGQPGHAVAPGSLVAIFGNELASGLQVAASIPLAPSMGEVIVRFNNVAAPIMFVSPGQINAQLPWNLLAPNAESGVANVVVSRGANNSQPREVPLARFSPGIYTFRQDGTGPAVTVNGDGTVSQPAGSIPGVNARPVRIGEGFFFYASGLGPVDPPLADGANSLDALRRTVTEPVVRVGGVQAQVFFAGVTPEFPGVYQVNLIAVPQGVQPGDAVPLQISIGGLTTSDLATIAVAP
jgi:uncharacterized protein (TIGR03437 family)